MNDDTNNRPTKQTQARIRSWIASVLEQKDWSMAKLARQASVSPATIHRALNDDRFVTSNTVLQKIAEAAQMASPLERGTNPSGLGEAEAVFTHAKDAPVELKPGKGQGVWTINSRANEIAGYLPGDQVLVDERVSPERGDFVCAQIYHAGSGTAETVFRVYEPPYLVPRTFDTSVSVKPELVDNDRVRIWGVTVKMLRTRR